MKKTLISLATALAVAMSAYSDNPQIIVPRSGGDVLMLQAMSPNGKYAASVDAGAEDVDNPQPAGGVFYQIDNGQCIAITAPAGWSSVADIADNGLCVGMEGGLPGVYDPWTQQWTTYDTPEGFDLGQFIAVTPDGHYAVGIWRNSYDEFGATPMLADLQTGAFIDLPGMPEVDLAGDPATQNAPYDISPDGRYILGHVSESFWMPVGLFAYIYDTVDHTWQAIGYDYDASTKTYACTYPNMHFLMNRYFSTDGAWVCGTAYMVYNYGELNGGSEGYAAYRYNVANKELQIFDAPAEINVSGEKITTDGTLLGCAPTGNPYPTAMVRYGNFYVSLDQILSQAYGMNLGQYVPGATTGSFQNLSADGLTALMRTYNDCYIIKMPESFAQAAAKVDLLAVYQPNIPEGAELTKISEVKVTFDRSIAVSNAPSQVKLLGDDGTVVRNASGFAVSTSNDHQLVITFRTTALESGKNYTIDIPADMIWLQDDATIKNKPMQLKYVGRADTPVQMVSVSPADGSTIAQLDPMASMIVLEFDTQVAISENSRCTLYNADDNSVVTYLSAAAQGKMVYMSPLTAFYLYKGSNYRVVLEAGSVTDLSGTGGCDEIVMHYQGSYVRELSSDDLCIFNADCDTYENFIYWQTEFNEPGEIAAEWGFTAETPWLLVRDEDSENQALAAHSMFESPAQADDWLVTPQIYIPDANTYLAFDAQRYMASKADVLKVYIYETEAVYNYFSDELCEEFRANGFLAIDEVVPAGPTDEGLENEWTHYTYDLSAYAGKNIYIAFVNNNYDQSALIIDNVQVVRNMNFLITNRTPLTVVDKTKITVSGIVAISSEIDFYDGISLVLRDGEGTEVSRIVDAGAHLEHGDTYDFAFDKQLAIEPGYETSYTIEVASGDVSSTFAYKVKDLLFEPSKRVVLEEYSGALCGNCPLGIRAVEYLEGLYPDNFLPVILRTYSNDMYANGVLGYSSFLGCESVGAPSGRVDRGRVLMPAVATPDGYKFLGQGIVHSDGTDCYLWADAVMDALSVPAEADIDVATAYDASTGQLTADCQVRFSLNTDSRSLGVFVVVVEDNLFTVQSNYLNTSTDPALGEWGANGSYGTSVVTTWSIDDVARDVASGYAYNGNLMAESDFSAGQSYNMTVSSDIDADALTDWRNASVVVMLIDQATGKVINANRAKFNSSAQIDIESEDSTPVYYNLQGQIIDNPQPGQIYIKMQNHKARKVLIKN